jgi:hypothetical protein
MQQQHQQSSSIHPKLRGKRGRIGDDIGNNQCLIGTAATAISPPATKFFCPDTISTKKRREYLCNDCKNLISII